MFLYWTTCLCLLFTEGETALTGQVYPNITNVKGADLEFSFTYNDELYSGAQLSVSLTGTWIYEPFETNTRCWLSAGGKVVNGDCTAANQKVLITMNTGDPNPVTGPYSVVLTGAVCIESSGEKVLNVTIFLDDIQQFADNTTIRIDDHPSANITNQQLNFTNTINMLYSYSKLTISFDLNQTLKKDMEITIGFNQSDTFLGNIVFTEAGDSAMECSAPFTQTTQCHSYAGKVFFPVDQEFNMKNPVNITIDNYRITQSSISAYILITNETHTIAYRNINNTFDTTPLNLACCFSFNQALLQGCTSQAKSVCKSFGGNGGDYTPDMNRIDFLFQQEISPNTKNQDCEEYFTPATAEMMGNGLYCFMATNNRRFVLYLGTNATFRSQNAYFRAGAFHMYKDNSEVLPEMSIYVSYPKELVSPTPIISPNISNFNSPPAVLDCLQSQGTARRPFYCYWNIHLTKEEIKSRTIALKEGSHEITLMVTNFFDMSSNVSTTVNVKPKTSMTVMTVEITPNLGTFRRSAEIVLGARVISPIEDMKAMITYLWNIPGAKCQNSSSRTCVIPANSLQRDNYNASVKVNSAPQVSKLFTITSSPLMLLLRSISPQVSTNTSIVLDASPSYDPDQTQPSSWIWNWTCTNENKSIIKGNNSSDRLTYSLGKLPKGKYDVNVKAIQGTRNASAFISFEVVEEWKPLVVIEAPRGRLDSSKTNILSGKTDCQNCGFQWNTSWNSTGTVIFASSSSLQSVMLKPGSLGFGQSYTFILTVWNNSSSNNASITLTVNNPPVGGTFTVTPSEGEEMTTPFTLQVQSWLDLDEDYPLTYQYFRYISKDQTQAISPSMIETEVKNAIFSRLNGESDIIIECRVADSLGAFFPNVKSMIRLNPANGFYPRNVSNTLLNEAKNEPVVGSILLSVNSLLVYTKQNNNDMPLLGPKLTSDLIDILEIATIMTPRISTSDYIAYTETIGNIANSNLGIGTESLEKAVQMLANIGKNVVSLEQNQGEIVLQALSSCANASLSQANMSSSRDSIEDQLLSLSTALLNRTLPSAEPIFIKAPIYALNLQRKLKEGILDSNPSFNTSLKGKTPGNASISFGDVRSDNISNSSVLDFLVFAFAYLPKNASLARNKTRNFLPEIYMSSDGDEIIIIYNRTEFSLTGGYDLGDVGAISAEALHAGENTEFGTIAGSASQNTSSGLNVSFLVSTNSSLLQCVGYEEELGYYSYSFCATLNFSDHIECKCRAQTTVSLISTPNKFAESIRTNPVNDLDYWTAEPTIWGMSLSITLIIAIASSLFVTYRVDSNPDWEKEKKLLVEQLRNLKETITVALINHILDSQTDPWCAEMASLAAEYTDMDLNELCKQSQKICFCCRKKCTHPKAKRIYAFRKSLLKKIQTGSELSNIFSIGDKVLSKSMQKLLIKNIDMGHVLVQVKLAIRDELPAILLDNKEKKRYFSFLEQIDNDIQAVRSSMVRPDLSDHSEQPAESLSLLIRTMTTNFIEERLRIVRVYDVVPVDHWWQTFVEKHLVLNVFLYNQVKVFRTARVILLWDYVLVQLVCLGLFLQDYSLAGQNELATISSWWESTTDSNFWLYQLYITGISFLWTTLLDILINISSEDFLTNEKKWYWQALEALGWVLCVVTLAACLSFSFQNVNSYKDNHMTLAKWFIAFAISLVKDVMLGFHIKGFFYVIVLRIIPYIWRYCCWSCC